MKILSYWGIALPPTSENSNILTDHFTERSEHLLKFLELPGQNLAQYCTKERISFGVYQWLSDQIGGGNYA